MFDAEAYKRDCFVSIDEETFQDALEHYGIFLGKYLFHDDFPQFEEEDDFLLHVGDIRRADELVRLPGCNVLVIGNVEAKVLDLYERENGEPVEGATLQVTGDLTCRDLNHGFERFTVVGGNLRISRFMNLDYEDSDFVVLGDADVVFLGGYSITCGGEATIKYGNGDAIGLDFWDLPSDERQAVAAQNDEAASSKFAGFDLSEGGVRDELRGRILGEWPRSG